MLAYSSTGVEPARFGEPHRALSVVSVEHERDWHSVVSQRLSPYQNAAVGLIDADAELHAGYV